MTVIEVEIADRIALVRLNRPDARNAMDPEMVVTLAETWERLADDEDVWVCVVTGAEGSTFCAGFDLATFIPLMTGSAAPTDGWGERVAIDPTGIAGKATLRDFDLGKPLIVAANGHAIAGGFELLLAGDLRVVADGSRLGLSEVRLGLIPAMGGTARLARQIPPALAAEFLLTAEPIGPEQALAAGLINRVVPAGDVVETAMTLARTVAANAPLAVRAARDVMRSTRDLTETEVLRLEAEHSTRLAQTSDAVEGPRAFLEKRAAEFRGR